MLGGQQDFTYRGENIKSEYIWSHLIHLYSGTPLLWTPWGPGKVSCLEGCPHFKGKFLQRKHSWDIAKCPYYRGVLISGVSFKRGSSVNYLS